MALLNVSLRCVRLLSILTFIGLSKGQTNVFTKDPEDATYAEREEAVLTCAISSSVSGTHQWAKGPTNNPDYISYDNTVYSKFDTRFSVSNDINVFRLTISDLQQQDAGVYFCILYTSHYEYSKTASLHILSKWPRSTCTTSPQEASIGNSVTFTCTSPSSVVVAVPITWYNPELRDFGGTEIVSPGKTYTEIKMMHDTDNYGNFSCYIGRNTGHGTNCIESPLQIPPTPKVIPESRTKLEGENAEFDCIPAVALPNVTRYTWYVQSQVEEYHEYTRSEGRFRVRRKGTNFRVRNLTLPDNEMQVWCKAQNSLGVIAEAIKRAVVYVQHPIESTTIAEKTNFDPEDNSNSMGIVIGGTISGLILLVVIILLIFYLIKDKDFSKFKLKHTSNYNRVKPTKSTTTKLPKNTHRSVAETAENSNSLDPLQDGTVLYALPQQMGGGTIKVETVTSAQECNGKPMEQIQILLDQNITYNKTRTATLHVGHRGPTEAKSEIRSSPLRPKSLPSSAYSVDSPVADGSDYVLYSLPLQKGGGTLKVRSRNASMESINKAGRVGQTSTECVDGASSYAEVREKDGGQIEEPAYADVGFQSTRTSSYVSQQSVEYANTRNTTEEATYEGVQNASNGTDKRPKRESGYANMNKGVEVDNDDSSYVNMDGNEKKASESEYAEVNFESFEGDSLTDSSFDDDLEDDPQNINVEGLVYAHVEVDITRNKDNKENIIGSKDTGTDATVYADIKMYVNN